MINPMSDPAPVTIEEINSIADMREALVRMTLLYDERCRSINDRLRRGAKIDRTRRMRLAKTNSGIYVSNQ
jgi:hypothetical protein